MSKEKSYTVTAALPYANGPVHIGHLAGVYVPADIFVRFQRSNKKEIVFVCGSDEHGVPITLRARKEGVSPQEIVDKYHDMIRESFEKFGISFDIYSRTSSPTHHQTASEFFTNLDNKNKFTIQDSEQYFDPSANQFLADRYIIGTCPKCGFDNAYGDQCEKCGSTLSPSELKNPRSALSGDAPILKNTKHWFIPLNEYEKWLTEWIIKGHKSDWKTNVYGQCKSWIDQGLNPRAVTRDLDWGVPVPLKEAEGKVLYVWFDAPIGYISATKEWAEANNKNWEDYWKAKDRSLIHFIGKDNIVFHCIIFPIMLKAHGEYILPENVPANEFLNLEGDKISTSRNWAVWLHEYLEEFPEKQDVLRYVLCANAPESKDNDFTWKDFQARNNNELAAILGNFVKRALDFTNKNFDGKVPERGELFDPEKEIIKKIEETPSLIAKAIETYKFREALALFIDLARAGNKYLAETEPWKLVKENKERAATVMNLAIQTVANLAILSEPFLPFTSKKVFSVLNLESKSWPESGTIQLVETGQILNTAEVLFSKIEDQDIQKQLDKLENTKTENSSKITTQAIPMKDEIVFDDFMKVDLRTGTIIGAEKVDKSKKLLKLEVDLGFEKRTILSGISEHYSPEEVMGKQVSVVINLAPRKMMGFESKGMILLAENEEGKLVFVTPEKDIDNGSVIR
ncbi:MAG: methionine--tRNA ligase [Cyclobacteriaceae bacterium]|nr:methionine--tRNA ligase [Cyclobacteriaceae bacterium]